MGKCIASSFSKQKGYWTLSLLKAVMQILTVIQSHYLFKDWYFFRPTLLFFTIICYSNKPQQGNNISSDLGIMVG